MIRLSIKTLQKVGREGACLNIIQATYDRCTANIILSGEMHKAFPLRSETRKGCPLSLLLFNIVLEVLAMAVRKGKRSKRNPKGNELRLSLFADDVMLYIENPKDAT